MVPLAYSHVPMGPRIVSDMCNDRNFCMPGCKFACKQFKVKLVSEIGASDTNNL